MTYGDFDNRLYAKWSDFDPPRQLKVEAVRVEEMPKTKKNEIVLWFDPEEFKYGVALTAKCNRDAMIAITGSIDPMDAIGVTIELYADMTVRNPQTGEMGAVRIRAPGADHPAEKLRKGAPRS
jgi:hypothetical protein